MTIFQTKADVDNLQELRRRKKELTERIKSERAELNQTVQEIKEDFTPARIIKNTIGAFTRPSDNGLLPAVLFNSGGLRLAANFAVNTLLLNSRRARIVRAVIPVAIQALPGVVSLVKSIFKRRKVKKAKRRLLLEHAGQEN